MSSLSIKVYVTERLLIVVVISLIACCVYWAARRPTDVRLPTTVVNGSTDDDGRPAPCGFETFRALARQRADGYVPGSGTWTHNGTRIDRFHPSVCRLNHGQWIPEDELATCLRRDTVRYIAIVGDSNGRYYLRLLHRLLSMAPAESQRRRIVCGPVVRHDGLTYNSYQSRHVLVKHRCPCGGYCTLQFTLRGNMRGVHCYVLQARCTVDNVTDVVLEYVASWYTIDRKVQVFVVSSQYF